MLKMQLLEYQALMIKDLTQIICKYRKIVVSLHRKVEIANTPYRGYIVPSWHTPTTGKREHRPIRCVSV